MNYVVFDLEWNQGNTGSEKEEAGLSFEIIEIGAVKLSDSGVIIDRFSQLIRPAVHREMHQVTGRLLHLQMRELEGGKPFAEAAEAFLEWCGQEEYLFCTWGNMDLTELQRNMKFYQMTPISEGPIAFLDVQKLFSLAFEDGKSRRSLEYAVDLMELEKDIPFHRAFSDAYYTGKLLQLIMERHGEVLRKLSFDVFHPPASREKEVKVQFDNYVKYISREFESKEKALADREVTSSRCYLCRRNLKKKLKWFTVNNRHYYCLAWCGEHGYLKGKIRLQKSENDKVYVVKTTKLISEEEADKIRERSLHAKVPHKHSAR